MKISGFLSALTALIGSLLLLGLSLEGMGSSFSLKVYEGKPIHCLWCGEKAIDVLKMVCSLREG